MAHPGMSRVRHLHLALGLALLASSIGLASQAATSPSIDGVVVGAGANGQPIAGATVVLASGSRTLSTATTDSDGRFTFRDLTAPCSCTVRASKPGFFDGRLGEGAEGSAPTRVELAVGQHISGITLKLTATASISGRVAAPGGLPIAKVPVRLIMRVSNAERTYLVAGPAASTNDLGEYTIGGLRAAEYLVQLPAGQRDPAGRSTTGTKSQPEMFYPNAPTIQEAAPLTVSAGDNRRGIDFDVSAVSAFAVSGHVNGQSEDMNGLIVRLVGIGAETLSSAIATTTLDGSGQFRFPGIPPGAYSVIASRSVSGLEDLSALMTASIMPRPLGAGGTGFVSVDARSISPGAQLREWSLSNGRRMLGQTTVSVADRDVQGIAVPLATLATVSGTIEWDDGSQVHATTIGAVRLESAVGDPTLGLPRAGLATVGSKASFKIEGVRPGEYVLRVGERPRVKSAQADGRDLLGDLLTVGNTDIANVRVVLSPTLGQLTGSLSPVPGDERFMVIAFPADPSGWSRRGWSADRVRLAQPSATGAFRLTDMPAGAYNVVAVRESDSGRWRDDAFLRRVSAFATRVSLGWGDASAIQVRVAPKG